MTSRRRLLAACCTLLLGYGHLWSASETSARAERSGAPAVQAPAPVRVMVLQFDNRTGDAGNDALGGGIADSVVHALANVRGLIVLERQRVEQVLKEQAFHRTGYVDAATAVKVGKLIAANRSVGGGFQTAGPAMRISSQLVDVETGRTMRTAQVQGDYPATFFDLQDELAGQVAAQLQVTISPEEQRRVAAVTHATSSLPAFQAYSLGLDALRRGDYAAALAAFEAALALDARYALAWSGQARVLALQGYLRKAAGDPQAAALLGQARDAAERALALQPELGEAHLAAAMVANAAGDFAAAARAAERALELLPNSAEGHYLLGVARKQVLGGDRGIQEKVRLFRRALELDPTYTLARNDLGVTYDQQLQDHAQAVVEFREAVRINPRNAIFHDNLGVNLFQLKRYDEALEEFQQALDLDPASPLYQKRVAVTRKALGAAR